MLRWLSTRADEGEHAQENRVGCWYFAFHPARELLGRHMHVPGECLARNARTFKRHAAQCVRNSKCPSRPLSVVLSGFLDLALSVGHQWTSG